MFESVCRRLKVQLSKIRFFNSLWELRFSAELFWNIADLLKKLPREKFAAKVLSTVIWTLRILVKAFEQIANRCLCATILTPWFGNERKYKRIFRGYKRHSEAFNDHIKFRRNFKRTKLPDPPFEF